MKEDQIVDSINKGELNGFQYLYKEYYPALCIYAKNFTKSKDIAEEIVQDMFINLWEQHGRLKIEHSLKSFLFVSVRNGCLNHLKHLQVVNKFNEYYTKLLTDAQDLYIITQESGESHLIADELEREDIKGNRIATGAVQKIFIMSRFDCLKHQEIAGILGVSINTVHHQTSIALEKLRIALKGYIS